jgi:hypothetical protein
LYFQRDIDRTKVATAERARAKLRREATAAKGNNPVPEAYDEEAELLRAMNLSRAEVEYQRGVRVQQRKGIYEGGSGSGSASRSGNPVSRLFQRATSQRESHVMEDYNLASGGRRGRAQPRIDTGSWTQKGKNAQEAIGKAWSKIFHIAEYLVDRQTIHIL